MIKIHHEDNEILIVEKPTGLMVHPNKQFNNDDKSLLHLLKNQTNTYLYPINRLDRPVSGLVVFAKNRVAAKQLNENWARIEKKYIGLVRGKYEKKGVLDFPLKHKKKGTYQDCITHFQPLEVFEQASLLSIEIKTGRFHQIRRHFARTVNHVLGDRTYGKKKYNDFYLDNYNLRRIFLHSSNLLIPDEAFGREIQVSSCLPRDLEEVLNSMRK